MELNPLPQRGDIMRSARHVCRFMLFPVLFGALAHGQAVVTPSGVVPNLINYSGVLTDSTGKPLSGIVGVTFLLYKDQQGGAPLWMATQNVQPNKYGHYTVQLGSTTSQGLPRRSFCFRGGALAGGCKRKDRRSSRG